MPGHGHRGGYSWIAERALRGGCSLHAVEARVMLCVGAGRATKNLFTDKVGCFSTPFTGQAAYYIDLTPAWGGAAGTEAGEAACELYRESANHAAARRVHVRSQISLDQC